MFLVCFFSFRVLGGCSSARRHEMETFSRFFKPTQLFFLPCESLLFGVTPKKSLFENQIPNRDF